MQRQQQPAFAPRSPAVERRQPEQFQPPRQSAPLPEPPPRPQAPPPPPRQQAAPPPQAPPLPRATERQGDHDHH
jgi:hypothetical protein